MLAVKNGVQQTRKTPIMTPKVTAALWSDGGSTAAPLPSDGERSVKPGDESVCLNDYLSKTAARGF